MAYQSENIRKSAFWLKDYINGRIIDKHFKEIQFLQENYGKAEAKKKRSGLLQNIIAHAVLTTPYYRNLGSKRSISDFPVINKSLIKGRFEDFRSESYRTGPLLSMTTSGSTGTPFTIYQDINKKYRNYADTLYFARKAGYEIGHKLYYLKIWSENNKKDRLQAWLQNIVPVDVLKLNDDAISNLINDIGKDKNPKGLLGYASAFDAIVQYLIAKESFTIKGNVRSAISISESLSLSTKKEMSKFFHTQVVSRYSNLENGIIAQQCLFSDEFHINTASYLVEIFDLENDELMVDPDALGRIVVTDLFNYAMPLLRYDTGDTGVLSQIAECDGKSPCLSRVEGRKLDLLYDTRGNLISSYVVYKNMWKYTEIKQYQLIQEGKIEYRFIININGSFTREKQLIDEFKCYLGEDADFKVEYVSEIPLLDSGKRKKIVNNYIKV